ncbi:flagellar biosynthetic protein FliO [candidate division KSB1 bacterium RBG_16_48_16]|nr:MAG: flagellar biosynthetic protein FliO [candidate division KSB1 bacterium RBG_16_48_16]
MKKHRKLVLKTLILFLLTSVILAGMFGFRHSSASPQSLQSQDGPQQSQDVHFGKALFRTTVSFALVILLLVLFLYGIRWIQRKSQTAGDGNVPFKVVGTLALAPKKSLHLVRIIDRVVVLGVTDGNLTLITELSSEEAAQLPKEPLRSRSSFASALASQFKHISGTRKM